MQPGGEPPVGERAIMKKIPVVETIGFAYNFTFGQMGAILGLTWLPLVLWAIGNYFALSHYYGSVPAGMSAGQPFMVVQAALVFLGWYLASFLLWAVVDVAVVRLALGLRTKPAFVHFALGMAELRVFASFIGLMALFMLFYIVLIIAAFGLLIAVGAGGASAIKGAAGLVVVLGLLAMAWIFIRLSFFIVPVAIVEKEIGLGRSWELTGGNFWRIVVIGLAVLLPAAMLAASAQTAVLGPEYFSQIMAASSGKDPGAATAQMRLMAENLPLLTGIYLFLMPFTIALQMGAGAYAYRSVMDMKLPPAA